MENYESLGVIGEGTYGVVMKARHRETGQIVAIKKFKESDEDEQVRKTSLREVRVLKQLRHDNVITLLEVFRRKGKLHLVFEYVEKTILEVLEKKPNGLDEMDVRKYMYQLLRGIEYCHSHNIIHRDVKPENILISKNGALKLCDFGFARTMSIGGKYTDYVATRWYRAPELLVGDVEYGKGVDVWAVGCIFTEISNGMPLFPGESDLDQLAHLMRCFGKITNRMVQIFRRNPLYVSAELPPANVTESLDDRFPSAHKTWLSFLKACLKNDPDQRESCSTLLSHPYFTERNFKADYENELRLIFEKENRQNGLRKEQPTTPLTATPEYAPALPQAQQRKDASLAPSPVPGHPALGNLWSQYLASATTELPDLATNTNKPSQSTHFPSTTKPPAQTIPPMSQPADPRGMYDTMMLQGANSKGGLPPQQKKNPSLFPTLMGTQTSQQPSTFTGYNLGSMTGSGGSGGTKDPISSQLSYKKKPQKKNVLSTLSLTAYGGNTSSSTGSGSYDQSASGMVLFGHATSTPNGAQQPSGQRSSKQW
jgi:cyclin-dependent kinase-like